MTCHCTLVRGALTPLGSFIVATAEKSKIETSNAIETHPLPRGGTDLILASGLSIRSSTIQASLSQSRRRYLEILVYHPGAPRVEEGFTVAQLPELLKDERAVIWVDMAQPHEG